MTQTQFVGAPQGAIWGYDPTTNLWLPIGASPKLVGPNGEIYGSLLVNVANATTLGQQLSNASSPVVIASDQSPVATKGGVTEVLALSAGSLNADLLPSMDVSAFKWFSCQITGTWSGTLTITVSNDNVNFTNYTIYRLSAASFVQTVGANDFIYAPILTRFLRIRMTSYNSGIANGVAEFYTSPAPALINQVVPANVVNTTPWLVTSSNNNFVQAAGGGLTVGKASPGFLAGGMISATGTVGLTVYDNASAASGTPLLVIPANPTVGQLFPVNGWAKNGITSGGVANCPGVTFFFA